MASTSAFSVALPLTQASQKKVPPQPPSSEAFFKPSKAIPVTKSNGSSRRRRLLQVDASLREKAVTGLTAAALTASMVIPEVAEAAESSVSPSLKNFLLSIVAGGVVVSVLVGAVLGVANFDPVKRS